MTARNPFVIPVSLSDQRAKVGPQHHKDTMMKSLTSRNTPY